MLRAPEIVEAVVGHRLPGSEDENVLHVIDTGDEVPGPGALQSAIAVCLGPDSGLEHSVTASEKSPCWELMGASPSDSHNPSGSAPPDARDTGDTGHGLPTLSGLAPPDTRDTGDTGHGLPTLGVGCTGCMVDAAGVSRGGQTPPPTPEGKALELRAPPAACQPPAWEAGS